MSESNGDKSATAKEPTNRLPDAEQGSPFDNLAGLRLRQDFASTAGVKKVLTTVPIDKPHKQHFVRVRPGEDWRLEAAILEIDETRERFLVLPELQGELLGEIKPVCLVTTINRQGTVSLWPLRLPAPDRANDRWAESAIEGAREAERNWVRVVPDMAAGMYQTYVATAALPEPEWPEDMAFSRILELAFRDRIIGDINHDILQRLWGNS